MQHHQIDYAVTLAGEARQKVAGLRRGERRTVDAAAKLRKRDGADLVFCKNEHVFRPALGFVCRAVRCAVMVSRRNDDLCAASCKCARQRLKRVGVGVVTVKEVACQQHQLAAVCI